MTATVLVVDDDGDIRHLVCELLRLSGLGSEQAPNGLAAVELLRTQLDEHGALPDLVLLDVQMPQVDGWDTLRAIRSDSEFDALPVVLCTVKGSDDDIEQAWTSGCDGYISKPFDIGDLVDEVLTVLARTPEERLAHRRERAAAAAAAVAAAALESQS